MTDELTGRTVVVTGAASGIGFEVARKMRDAGALVYAVDLAAPQEELDDVHHLTADVSSPADVQGFIEMAVRETGALDVVCNNAGVGSSTDVVTCPPDEWDHVFAVNVRGVFLGTKYAIPHMLHRGGTIVNTASAAALVGLPQRAAYCASKGAVVALTRQVAVEYAAHGIRCNCVCPGTVDSPWVERLMAETDDPSATRDALIARQPMGRLGSPAEIAEAIVFLASPASSFMTGSSMVVDGGVVAG
ncbi:glucose 1-dehydrogenase [Actinobacteria bacterium YIM 96077]|uniref:Short-chain dehydrogenase n=1 Tax=Phytoactinopolyspora halophila TaxID=1981511 RepID=A0A329QCF2_9ACTN|nr:glucose 1-dehydrogenase [Phytoactinopolyspora halophila]AYY13946.1 glucose 1-dehydrogenase [Actinobacteria bacterium YIM 96077]RAW10075.1 short-chain dehydrogenase [Phytoactinopolyspora halophila]